MKKFRPVFLVVGAGLSGATAARLAAEKGHTVVVVDSRPHVAGNAYDRLDEAFVMVQPYGPHIFHTSDEAVFAFLSRFTSWKPYVHKVKALTGGAFYPMPINLDTINAVYGQELTTETAQAFVDGIREAREIKTAEDVVVNAVGLPLYRMFIQGYTRKQWGLDPSELSPEVTARVTPRLTHDDRYFTDTHQVMPEHGFTKMVEAMLDHPLIRVEHWTFTDPSVELGNHIVYTGEIDRFFHYRYGKLPYRSLRFESETFEANSPLQPCAVVNYPGNEPWTRITEFRHLYGQQHTHTTLMREIPVAEGEPFYPVPTADTKELLAKYEELTRGVPYMSFIGRLAEYRYMNMDQCVASAIKRMGLILG